MTGWMWFLVTVIGVAALGAALFYGQRQSVRFRRDGREKPQQERATREIYRKEERSTGGDV